MAERDNEASEKRMAGLTRYAITGAFSCVLGVVGYVVGSSGIPPSGSVADRLDRIDGTLNERKVIFDKLPTIETNIALIKQSIEAFNAGLSLVKERQDMIRERQIINEGKISDSAGRIERLERQKEREKS